MYIPKKRNFSLKMSKSLEKLIFLENNYSDNL